MDGLRKVADNVPNQDLLKAALNQPLTKGADPFGTHESFGHHNNARLRAFSTPSASDYGIPLRHRLLQVGPFRRNAEMRMLDAL